MNTIKQEIIPDISLKMEHRLALSMRQKEFLLEERQNIIQKSIREIQINFFRIGKALAEIKKFKLYKNDFCTSWSSYINTHIQPSLHQSTISDYIGIVKMQIENNDFVFEEDIVKLGYKKAKLIKSKMNLIEKESDLHLKSHLKTKLKEFYLKSIDKEFRDLPYITYEKALISYLKLPGNSYNLKANYIKERDNKYFKVKWDTKNKKIVVLPKEGYENFLEKLYDNFLNLDNLD